MSNKDSNIKRERKRTKVSDREKDRNINKTTV